MSNFDDVVAFNKKFGLPVPVKPVQLTDDVFNYRFDFLHEELIELGNAFDRDDLAEQIDALVDLVYVALGTAVMMGVDWEKHWDEVQFKNMQKVRALDPSQSKRDHELDVVKPEGWTPPDHQAILDAQTDI